MTFAVLRVRGSVNVPRGVKDTLGMLRLHRVNHCVFVPDTPYYRGMLERAKDYITWGEIDAETLVKLTVSRGRLVGDREISNAYIKSNTKYKSIQAFARAIASGEVSYSSLRDVKPVIRLHPPIKGYEDIKRGYGVGGTLGYRGKEINLLLERMIPSKMEKMEKRKVEKRREKGGK